MLNWWNSLDALQHFFAYVAIPATLILCIQTILLLFGLGAGGDGELDSDTSGLDTGDGTAPDLDAPDTDVPDSWDGESGHDLAHDPGLRIFTIRGLVAFFSVFGWAGLALSRSGVPGGVSTLIAFLLGLGAMVVLALMLRGALGLQSDGTMNLKNALGLCGTVYLTVPPRRQGTGKITLVLQGQLGEFEALTDEPEPLKTGQSVQVIGLSGPIMVVCRK
ncbi:hypothetical protein [Intestinimonas butyriciproducens]|uniref:hypothetical protein n=1 Tax=Intestinimonas butyriciproducens TaxID=1297617 RepID=UPI00195B331B|nr:hypothetical protein [Intestinimonas butyriciproducens]MBM6917691.1 hypothetical protein [Intestinimonas butyriciproducens]